MKKLRIGTYPYTYGRVSVMKTALLQPEDYHRVMKMGVHEIISFLQGTSYSKEISELAVKQQEVDLMELALNKNMGNTFKKLRKISQKALQSLISSYVMRYDVADIKAILRGKYTKQNPEKIEPMLLAAGNLTKDQLSSLMSRDGVEEVVSELEKLGYSLKEKLQEFEQTQRIGILEDALDQQYQEQVFAFASLIPKEGKLFRQFLETELEIQNIINIMRLKRAGVEVKDIELQLTSTSKRFQRIVDKLMTAKIEDSAEIFRNTEYYDAVTKGIVDFKETQSLIILETLLQSHLLEKTLHFMRRNVLSVNFILG